jgi:hypothetical protein
MMDDLSSLARLGLCESKEDLALWFLTESDNGFRHVYLEARVAFFAADFGDGLRALDVRMGALNAQRVKSGDLPQTIIMRLEEQKSRMREVVSRGAA